MAEMSPAPGEAPAPVTALAGAELIRSLVPTLPNEAGVYRMLDERGEALYVGKAKSLQEAGAGLRQGAGAAGPAAAHGGADPRDGVRHHRQRGRGAAARGQPDQAVPAGVQHRPARRQELSLHLPAHRPRVPADRQASRRQAAGDRVFRPVRLGRCGQRHAERPAQGVPLAQLPRQHLRLAHPALPAVPDQALLGALRRPDRRRDLRADRRGGARVPLGQVGRGADPAAGRDARRQRQARLRARCRPARPAQGDGAHPGAAGHQHRGGRRRRRRGRASGGRAGLRPGVLLPGRPQLREPRLLPGAHQGRDVRRDPRGVPGAVLRRAGAGAAGAAGRAGARAGAAGRGAGRAGRAQGRAPGAASRRPSPAGRDRAHQRPPGAGAAARGHREPGGAARAAGRPVRPAGDAGPGRGLRQQPHPGQQRDRRLHRRRAGGLRQAQLSDLQHQGRRARGRATTTP